MGKIFDISKINFKCTRCGNCCYNVLRKMEHGHYNYDFQGNFVYNPQVSVSVLYTEVPGLEKNLKEKYNLELKVHPAYVLFLKDFQVGFIYEYQVGVKKKKYCRYYDLRKRLCKIYSIRPSSCRSYPLTLNTSNPTFPSIEPICTGIINEINKQNPNMREGDLFNFSKTGLIKAFFQEFLIFQVTCQFLLSQLDTILSHLGFLFFDPNMVKPHKVERFKLLDFDQFFGWAEDHIKDKRIVDNIEMVRLKIEKLRIETFSNLQSWKNNPNKIKMPFRF
ncbi:MAG TPA: YkgJ family cysteine cluster protein [bacterium]|nr:YkgJ family cysteine cluster protein [bacterium]